MENMMKNRNDDGLPSGDLFKQTSSTMFDPPPLIQGSWNARFGIETSFRSGNSKSTTQNQQQKPSNIDDKLNMVNSDSIQRNYIQNANSSINFEKDVENNDNNSTSNNKRMSIIDERIDLIRMRRDIIAAQFVSRSIELDEDLLDSPFQSQINQNSQQQNKKPGGVDTKSKNRILKGGVSKKTNAQQSPFGIKKDSQAKKRSESVGNTHFSNTNITSNSITKSQNPSKQMIISNQKLDAILKDNNINNKNNNAKTNQVPQTQKTNQRNNYELSTPKAAPQKKEPTSSSFKQQQSNNKSSNFDFSSNESLFTKETPLKTTTNAQQAGRQSIYSKIGRASSLTTSQMSYSTRNLKQSSGFCFEGFKDRQYAHNIAKMQEDEENSLVRQLDRFMEEIEKSKSDFITDMQRRRDCTKDFFTNRNNNSVAVAGGDPPFLMEQVNNSTTQTASIFAWSTVGGKIQDKTSHVSNGTWAEQSSSTLQIDQTSLPVAKEEEENAVSGAGVYASSQTGETRSTSGGRRIENRNVNGAAVSKDVEDLDVGELLAKIEGEFLAKNRIDISVGNIMREKLVMISQPVDVPLSNENVFLPPTFQELSASEIFAEQVRKAKEEILEKIKYKNLEKLQQLLEKSKEDLKETQVLYYRELARMNNKSDNQGLKLGLLSFPENQVKQNPNEGERLGSFQKREINQFNYNHSEDLEMNVQLMQVMQKSINKRRQFEERKALLTMRVEQIRNSTNENEIEAGFLQKSIAGLEEKERNIFINTLKFVINRVKVNQLLKLRIDRDNMILETENQRYQALAISNNEALQTKRTSLIELKKKITKELEVLREKRENMSLQNNLEPTIQQCNRSITHTQLQQRIDLLSPLVSSVAQSIFKKTNSGKQATIEDLQELKAILASTQKLESTENPRNLPEITSNLERRTSLQQKAGISNRIHSPNNTSTKHQQKFISRTISLHSP